MCMVVVKRVDQKYLRKGYPLFTYRIYHWESGECLVLDMSKKAKDIKVKLLRWTLN